MYVIGDTRPTIKKLQHAKIVTVVSSRWYELGVELLDDDQEPQLESIKADHDVVARRCSAMFSYWLRTHPDASWHDLIVALRAPGVELYEAAASVERTFHGVYLI